MLFHYREGQSCVWKTGSNGEDAAQSVQSWVATSAAAPRRDGTRCFRCEIQTRGLQSRLCVCLAQGCRFGASLLASVSLSAKPAARVNSAFLQRTQPRRESPRERGVANVLSAVIFNRLRRGHAWIRCRAENGVCTILSHVIVGCFFVLFCAEWAGDRAHNSRD